MTNIQKNIIADIFEVKLKEYGVTMRLYYSQDDWLSDRKDMLTGTDASALMNSNPYKTPEQVYLSKHGLLVDNDSIDIDKIDENTDIELIKKNMAKYRGIYLEDLGLKLFKQQNPNLVVLTYKDFDPLAINWTFCIEGFIGGSIDGIVYNPTNDTWSILEIKSTSPFKIKDWKEGIPMYYFWQGAHYVLMLPFVNGIHINCVSDWDYKRNFVYRPDIESDLTKLYKTLYNFKYDALTQPLPPQTVEEEVVRDIKFKDVETDYDLLVNQYFDLSKEITKLEKIKDTMKNNLLSIIGEDEFLFYNGNPILTRTLTDRTTFDSTKFKSENPELYTKYLKTSQSVSLKLPK